MWPLKRRTKVAPNNEPKVFSAEDYDGTFFHIKRVLRLLGIRLLCEDRPIVKMLWDAFYWFEYVAIASTAMQDILLVRDVMMEERNFEGALKIFRMIPCIGYLLQAMLKTHNIVYYRSTFENMVNELRSMWPQGTVSEEETTVLTESLKETKTFVKVLFYSNYILVLSIAVPPYVDVAKRFFWKDTPKILPFTNYLPYDPSPPVLFELTLTLQIWETIITVWCVLLGDLLFCVLLSHVTTQFELLCIRIQRLFRVSIDDQLIATYPLAENNHETSTANNDEYTSFERKMMYQREVAEIVTRHTALIRLAGDIEQMFSFAMLFNFFYNSIIICFCGFCCVLIEKWNVFMYKTFLITAFIQTWLLCWYGQKLFESSQKVADALYNSGWYAAPKEVKKSVLIMIQRSQKSVNVTTYGFSIICLINYTTIIKTAWSYFTLLLNVYTPGD